MKRLLTTIALLACSSALAEDADAGAAPTRDVPLPTSDEGRRVIDYYYYGKDKGPLLLEAKACLKVDTNKASPTKHECIEPVTGPVKKNTSIHLWSTWLVPQDGKYDNVRVQYVFNGEARNTLDVTLQPAFRTRDWRTASLGKVGKWTIKLLYGDKELSSTDVTVTEK
jgi:hypothetical protein